MKESYRREQPDDSPPPPDKAVRWFGRIKLTIRKDGFPGSAFQDVEVSAKSWFDARNFTAILLRAEPFEVEVSRTPFPKSKGKGAKR